MIYVGDFCRFLSADRIVLSGEVEVMVGVAMVEVAEEVAAEAMEVEAMVAEDTDRTIRELTICSIMLTLHNHEE